MWPYSIRGGPGRSRALLCMLAFLGLIGCATPVARPVTTTPYDGKWDEWSVRQCQERGGIPVIGIDGKQICVGWK